jgi:hypothetical protein
MGTNATKERYISARAMGRILGVAPYTAARIAERSNIRRKALPGAQVRYHSEDVEALAVASRQGRPFGSIAGRQAAEAVAS